MRCLAVLFLCLLTSAASARQIDLAVIQFPEPKTAEELNAALAGTQLAAMTNSDRTTTNVPYLKGGTVLFAQSGGLGILDSSTRLGALRADVKGALQNGRLDVRIDLSEGVKSGLRSFTSRSFQGAEALPPGSPRVIALRTITRKTQSGTKGAIKIGESSTTNAIIAQLR
jgi:hypothetical protein